LLPIVSVQTSFLLVTDIDLTSSMSCFQGILKALVLASNCSSRLNVKKTCSLWAWFCVCLRTDYILPRKFYLWE